MKLKKTRKDRTCHLCKATINKGDRYATKSVALGKTASWSADSRPSSEIPAEVWQPYRVSVPVCEVCAG